MCFIESTVINDAIISIQCHENPYSELCDRLVSDKMKGSMDSGVESSDVSRNMLGNRMLMVAPRREGLLENCGWVLHRDGCMSIS